MVFLASSTKRSDYLVVFSDLRNTINADTRLPDHPNQVVMMDSNGPSNYDVLPEITAVPGCNSTIQPPSGCRVGASTLTEEKAVTHSQELESQGYVALYSSYEEQTNGARNLWQLEIWAKLVGMRVVEPFAIDSLFGIKGATSNFSKPLKFSDYKNGMERL